MNPGEIWLISHPRLGKADYDHYFLVVDAFFSEEDEACILVLWLASDRRTELDLAIIAPHKPLPLSRPTTMPSQEEFDATGLTKSCHVGAVVRYLRLKNVVPAKGSMPGRIQGQLLQDITDWYGTSIVEGVWPRKKEGPKKKK